MTQFTIGTYTTGTSRGIYRARLDLESGQLSQPELAAELDNPMFLTEHPTLPLLISCSEIRRDGQRKNARLVVYRIERDGALTELGSQPTLGSGPCYVSTDASGRIVLVAHYASGSVASLPLNSAGELGAVNCFNQHVGECPSDGQRPDRQEAPHAHCILADPTNRFVCAVDLGLDQVLVYPIDATTSAIGSSPSYRYVARPGSGPRHLAFHPDGQVAFLIHELNNTLSALSWNAKEGTLIEIDTVSTLPADFVGESITAEVLVHPNGRFVFGSNRGHDSLAVFEFDPVSRRLTCLQHISTGGKTPRNFRIDPSGNFLLAANMDSNSVHLFRINSSTGMLTATDQSIEVGSPCCIKFQSDRTI